MNIIRNKIYCGDCFEILPKIKYDIMLTDPPYKDEDVNGDYYEFWEKFIIIAKKTSEYVIVFNNALRVYDLMVQFGRPYRVLIWSKGIIKYPYRWEPIFIYEGKNPSFNLNSKITSDQLPCQPIHKFKSVHPYEKPLKLMKYLVNYIPKSKIICDPFIGSGTTAVACNELGRKWIGIEINPEYCEIAERRLAQMELFNQSNQ